MASVKFSSAILLLIFVSSIFSTLINDSEVIVKLRDSEYGRAISGVAGESAFEHTIKLENNNVERGVTCPKAKEGAYQPEGVGSCLVAQEPEFDKRSVEQYENMKCITFSSLFVGHRSIDSVTVRARECKGVKRTECKDIQTVVNLDFEIDNYEGAGICFNNDVNRVCKNSKTENCIRYYTVSVSNAASNLELSKAQGACPSAYTTVMVASSAAALKGLSGRCLSSYRCDFEPLNLECSYARCTFEKQDFPLYIHASSVVPEPTKRGGGPQFDFDTLKDDECYKIRVPANQASAALDIFNPSTCGVKDNDDEYEYAVWVTAKICGKTTLYKQGIITPEPVAEGKFCNLDSQCEDGLFCDHKNTVANNKKPSFKCQVARKQENEKS